MLGRCIIHYIDSQVALKIFNSCRITSDLVLQCCKALEAIAIGNDLLLC